MEEIFDQTEALKMAFRRHASGVCLITLNDQAGKPVGFTATSVTSLGSNPALVTFNVARGASSWTALKDAEYVAISMLNENSVALAKKMAADHTKRFLDDDWFKEPTHKLPVFNAVNAVLICRVREYHEVEANAVFVVDVEKGLMPEEFASLLYHQRGYVIPGKRFD
ncbi:MAG: flavin reductase [Micrococcales bacterium]|nr:flavin reductase [Micrococcales bacterium]